MLAEGRADVYIKEITRTAKYFSIAMYPTLIVSNLLVI